MDQGMQPISWTPELVERFWDNFSRTRLTELSFGKGAGEGLLLATWQHLAPQGRHLDIGAGDGHLIGHMLSMGLRAGAFEPSPGRSHNLLARFADRPGFLGTFCPPITDTFDVAFASEVIEHVLEPQLPGFLQSLADAVRPGGRLVVTTPNREDLDLDSAICPACETYFHRWQHVRSYTPELLSFQLEGVGFETLVIHELDLSAHFYAPYAWALKREAPPPRVPREIPRYAWRDRLAQARALLMGRPEALPRELLDAAQGTQDAASGPILPLHIARLLANESTRVGGGTRLIYIGRRKG